MQHIEYRITRQLKESESADRRRYECRVGFARVISRTRIALSIDGYEIVTPGAPAAVDFNNPNDSLRDFKKARPWIYLQEEDIRIRFITEEKYQSLERLVRNGI